MDGQDAKGKARAFRAGDALAILAVLLAAALLLLARFGRPAGARAVVRAGGETVAELPLDTDAAVTVDANGYTLTVRVENGAVFVTDADCPDRVCEHTGRVSRAGGVIVCAPARVSVTVEEGGEADVDFVAG